MCLRLEENIADLMEEVEVFDQGFQVQENFEPGKLPPNLHLCLYFRTKVHLKDFSGKEIKPCHLCVISYFATLLRSME